MNRNLILIGLCIILSTSAAQANTQIVQTSEVSVVKVQQQDYAYSLMDKIRKDRSTIYNALNLTPSQLEFTRNLEKARYEALEPLVKELCIQRKEIKTLEANNGGKLEINAKKRECEKVTKEIKKVSEGYDTKFESVLNSQQHNKYEMIKKLRRDDFKKIQKIQENGKKQSDLRPFGVKVSQPAYSEQMEQQNSLKNKCKNMFNKK